MRHESRVGRMKELILLNRIWLEIIHGILLLYRWQEKQAYQSRKLR